MSDCAKRRTRCPRPVVRAFAALLLAGGGGMLAGCTSDPDEYIDKNHTGARFNSFNTNDAEEGARRSSRPAWEPPSDYRTEPSPGR